MTTDNVLPILWSCRAVGLNSWTIEVGYLLGRIREGDPSDDCFHCPVECRYVCTNVVLGAVDREPRHCRIVVGVFSLWGTDHDDVLLFVWTYMTSPLASALLTPAAAAMARLISKRDTTLTSSPPLGLMMTLIYSFGISGILAALRILTLKLLAGR